jgi:hypothetical protein
MQASGLPGESAGGVSPSAALRTGRDGLPSSGPHSPAGGERDKLPVGEQARLVLVGLLQPGHRFGVLAAEPFELVHGPAGEVLVDAPCEEAQLGAVEGSVIAVPPRTWGLIASARPDRSVPLRRLRCQALICWPFAFLALPLMAGEKPVK